MERKPTLELLLINGRKQHQYQVKKEANIANLWAKLRSVTAFLLSAVGCTRRETGVALAANHLVAVGDGSQLFERWLDNATSVPTQPEVSFN